MRARAIACAASALIVTAACSPAAPPRPALAPSESWCPDGFEVGPQDTCFAVPEAHGKDTPVLVYLHGMYAGHGSPEEWALVRTATQKGFAVLVPRGKRGLCAWKAELADHFCWPREPEDPQSFTSIVAEWDKALWQIDALLDGGTHKRFVLGSANGAFFAEHLATHGYFPAQAYAIVNGGALEPTPPPAAAKPLPPILLVAAEAASSEAPKTKALHEELAKAGWPHAYCGRQGDAALASTDLDAALAFFKKHAGGGPAKGQGGALACEAPLKPGP